MAALLLKDSAARILMRDAKSTPDDKQPDADGSEEFALPTWPTLPDFAFESDVSDGVQIDTLAPGTKVRVQTRNSEYWLTVLQGGRRSVLIQGGILPTVAEARLEGATDGGSAMHSGWIEVNRSLELVCGPRRIITSRVRGISIEAPASPSSAHRAA
jgi:hypothetical protein